MFDDQAVGQPKSQPGAFEFFGGKKRFQYAVAQLFWNARTFVMDGKNHARNAMRAAFTDADAKAAVVWRSVNGVADQVGKNLAQLAGESVDAECGAFFEIDCDVLGFHLH